MEIKNKTVVITGAASGLGAATARKLSQQHANIILLDRQLSEAKKIAQEINGTVMECDVTSEEAVQQAISSLSEIHVVVNCAGVVHGARLIGKQGAMPY